MKNFSRIIAITLVTGYAEAEDSPVLAKDLAAKLSALQQDGTSFVRLKLEVKPADGSPKFALQLQIKQKRTAGSTELVYQVLWPKERTGEAVLLKQSGDQTSGTLFTPPNTVKSLSASQMKDPLFGSALSYTDALENFFAWEDQKIIGTEVINKVDCQILESRAGKGAPIVRSWIDIRRLVPLRVEKYSPSGGAVRRITTEQVVSDDLNRNLPAYLSIQDFQKGITSVLDGSKLKHGVKYADSEFTTEGLGQMATPRSE